MTASKCKLITFQTFASDRKMIEIDLIQITDHLQQMGVKN